MNKVFKIIWNAALNRFDVVSEFAKAGKKCKSSSSLTINTVTGFSLILGLGSLITGTALAQPLPTIVISSTESESDVQRDSATGPAVVVTNGGNYTGTNVTLTSQAPASGGNTAALYVNTGGKAYLDADSSITMNTSSQQATVCCTYGIVVDGNGSMVDSSATIIGSTGGAGVYNGGVLNLQGGSLSGLFGIVSSGAGSLITGNADISGSGVGTGVRAELGGAVVLSGGKVLSNGMVATDAGSSISTSGTEIVGTASANNGASLNLVGGSVRASGYGVSAVYAGGPVASHVTTSADISVSGSNASAVTARNGSTINIIGGTLSGASSVLAAIGKNSTITFSNASLIQGGMQGSTAVYAAEGAIVQLNSGTISAPGWNNTTIRANGIGSAVYNQGTNVTGVAGSSIGAQAINGGSYIFGSGTMSASNTGVQASGTGSSVLSSGNISAVQRAVHATNGGSVTVDAGSLATTTAITGMAGIVADSGGQVELIKPALLDSAAFAGNGIQVSSGGVVNLAGGMFYINGKNSSGLIIDGVGSAINSSATLSVYVYAASGKAIEVANGAAQVFHNLVGRVTGSNGNVIQSNSGANGG